MEGGRTTSIERILLSQGSDGTPWPGEPEVVGVHRQRGRPQDDRNGPSTGAEQGPCRMCSGCPASHVPASWAWMCRQVGQSLAQPQLQKLRKKNKPHVPGLP